MCISEHHIVQDKKVLLFFFKLKSTKGKELFLLSEGRDLWFYPALLSSDSWLLDASLVSLTSRCISVSFNLTLNQSIP